MKLLRILAVPVALFCIGAGLWQLESTTAGLSIDRATVGETPVTVFRPKYTTPAPVVVIAHGFAGSQQLMQPFAETLARNGFIAVTFCLGHGHNPRPMTGDVTKVEEGPTPALVREFGKVAAFAQSLPGNDGRIAVLGHSMASDIVIRYAQAHRTIPAHERAPASKKLCFRRSMFAITETRNIRQPGAENARDRGEPRRLRAR